VPGGPDVPSNPYRIGFGEGRRSLREGSRSLGTFRTNGQPVGGPLSLLPRRSAAIRHDLLRLAVVTMVHRLASSRIHAEVLTLRVGTGQAESGLRLGRQRTDASRRCQCWYDTIPTSRKGVL